MSNEGLVEGGLAPQDKSQNQPDGSTQIVGFEGIPVRQDVDGTQIQRLGVAGADADWGPETITIPANGEIKIATPDEVGGTQSCAGIIESRSDRSLSVIWVWSSDGSDISSVSEAESDPGAVVERPDGSQLDTQIIVENVTTKGDDAMVFVQDESGFENEVVFTLNFH